MPSSGKVFVGAVELAMGGRSQPCVPPCVVVRAESSGPTQSASSGFFAAAELTAVLRPKHASQCQRPGIGATSGEHSADTEPLRLYHDTHLQPAPPALH